MEKQEATPKTLGQAIDAMIQALSGLDGVSQGTAIRSVCEHLKIRLPESVETKPPVHGGVGSTPSRSPGVGVADVRALREEKHPSSANEMAAIVAYYLSELALETERKSEVGLEEMIKYFKQANFPLPKQPRMLLANARNAGYFDPAGNGKYRLNPVGYNLVAHNLPRGQAGDSSGAGSRRPKKRRSVVRSKKR